MTAEFSGELLARLREVDDPIALLAGIFAHSPVAFQIYRADGHCLLTNEAFRKLFGAEPPPEYNVLEDERASGMLGLIQRALRGEVVQVPPIWFDSRELRIDTTEAQRVAIESTIFPLRGRDGAIEHVAVVVKDVTVERTLLEQAEHERDLLKLIIEQSGDGIIVADATGTVRMFNERAERQHGAPLAPTGPEASPPTYLVRALDGRELSVEETPLSRALHGETVERARWVVEWPDGTRRILSGTATPLRMNGSTPVGAVLITRDETAQLEDERRMRFQATVLRNIRDSVIVTDLEGTILDWNEGATAVFGYEREEMLGRSAALLYPEMDRDRLTQDLLEVAQGQNYIGEWQGTRKDGSSVCVDVKTTLMHDEAGRPFGYIGIGEDVTDRMHAEEQRARADRDRERALAMAESASRAKDEFLAMLGHELRNPLSPIVTALQLMKLRGDGATRELSVIERQVEHLVRLVDDLLDVSRITRGKVELARQPIELDIAVIKAIEMAGPLLEQRRHRFEVDIPSEGMRLSADVARLAQVISNLLTNAAKYTKHGGSITLTAHRGGEQIVLMVKDDGMGIDAELLPQIFDLFVQGQRSSARAEGGLGIGLTLVKNLVQLHGGTVEARSDGTGKGSEFIVRLPALPDAPKRVEATTKRRRHMAAVARRIVVVDDNVDAAELMAELLARAGHDVRVAYDGPQTLRLVKTFHPEVALLDIGLPVMDGYELAERLRATLGPRSPRMIAVTGYGQSHDRARSREAGFDDHLVKPVDPQQLLARIDLVAAEPHESRPS